MTLTQCYFNASDLASMLGQMFGAAYNISWKDATNSLIINRFDGRSMHIWTDAELLSQKGNANPQSSNAMLETNPAGAQINASSFTTIFVTTCPYDRLFLQSWRLTSDGSFTIRSHRDVLHRIPINSGYQDVIVASTLRTNHLRLAEEPSAKPTFASRIPKTTL